MARIHVSNHWVLVDGLDSRSLGRCPWSCCPPLGLQCFSLDPFLEVRLLQQGSAWNPDHISQGQLYHCHTIEASKPVCVPGNTPEKQQHKQDLADSFLAPGDKWQRNPVFKNHLNIAYAMTRRQAWVEKGLSCCTAQYTRLSRDTWLMPPQDPPLQLKWHKSICKRKTM